MIANFSRYIRFIFHRERWTSLFWILGIGLFSLGVAAIYPTMFPDKESITGMATTLNTPPMIAMMGPLYPIVNGVLDVEAMTPAMLFAQQCLMWIALSAIIMNIFFVNRYTRADEELGRSEMIIGLPVGRLTIGTGTIVMAFLLNVIIALASGAGALVLAGNGGGINGALLVGFSIGMQGFVFAGLALVCAQIFSTASATLAVPFIFLILSYILRAAGDMEDAVNGTDSNILSFLSPLGLGLKVSAFYENNWFPVVGLFAQGIILSGIALAVNSIRDIGFGLIPARKGRAKATIFLQSPMGYAWRISRSSFIGWGIGLLALGASYGSVIGSISDFVQGNQLMQQMLEQTAGGSSAGEAAMTDAFIAMIASIMMIVTAIPIINTINRFYSEEKHGRLEQVLACSVSRVKLFGAFLFLGILQAVLFPLAYSLGMYGVASGSTTVKALLESSFVYLPALLFILALSVLLVGFLPHLSKFTWALLGYSFLAIFFGRIIPNNPVVLGKLTPYGYIPQIPVEEFASTPLAVLCILAVVLIVAGFMGIRKRDIGV